MALSNKMVEVAFTVLKDVNPLATKQKILKNLYRHLRKTHTIYLLDEKEDGGFETIFTYITGGVEQEQLFAALACQVTNTSFIRPMDDGTFCIGFF